MQVGDIRVGLMTCYDVRFPEVARSLVVRGADLLSVPAAWVRGPGKEWHWEVMVTARALENTCYVAAVGECGPRNIGCSMLVDPMGVAVARAGSGPDLLFANVDKERMRATREVLPCWPTAGSRTRNSGHHRSKVIPYAQQAPSGRSRPGGR